MGLRDKASKVFDAVRRGDRRGASEALTDALQTARVRVMDEVVSRVSGHAVHTSTERQQPDLSSEVPLVGSVPVPHAAPAPAPAPEAAPASNADAPLAVASPKPEARAPSVQPEPAASSVNPTAVQPAQPQAEPTAAPPPRAEPAVTDRAAQDTLASNYGDNHLVLVVRDPTWAFAHWNFSPEKLQAMSVGLVDPRALLRFYELGSDTPLIDADVTLDTGRYYLRVPRPGRTYEARLVLVDARGEVREVARSNDAEPPSPQASAPLHAPRFVRMDAQVALLDRRDEVRVPPPRLLMDIEASRVRPPASSARTEEWAGVLAQLRGRRAAESTQAWGPSSGSGIGSGAATPQPTHTLREAFETQAQSSQWVTPEPASAPPISTP